MIRSRAMRRFMLVLGVLLLVVGALLMLAGGDEDPVVTALVLFPFSALLLLFGVSKPPERGSREGIGARAMGSSSRSRTAGAGSRSSAASCASSSGSRSVSRRAEARSWGSAAR